MNKKIIAIFIALLSCASIATAVLATKSSESTNQEQYPKVEMIEGVAFDKINNKTEQAVFLIMKYGTKESIYFIIGEEAYKMVKIEEVDFGNGTKVFRYKNEEGDILTILTQKFGRWGCTSVSGDFKNYIITFKPICTYQRDFYITKEKYPGLGPLPKEVKEEIIAETRPVKFGLNKIANRERINIGKIIKSASSLEEWVN